MAVNFVGYAKALEGGSTMSRPLSGTKEGDLATARWRKTMQMRYGDVTKKMQEVGRKGGLVKTPTGGFASMTPERRAELGRKGGHNRRGWKKNAGIN